MTKHVPFIGIQILNRCIWQSNYL